MGSLARQHRDDTPLSADFLLIAKPRYLRLIQTIHALSHEASSTRICATLPPHPLSQNEFLEAQRKALHLGRSALCEAFPKALSDAINQCKSGLYHELTLLATALYLDPQVAKRAGIPIVHTQRKLHQASGQPSLHKEARVTESHVTSYLE